MMRSAPDLFRFSRMALVILILRPGIAEAADRAKPAFYIDPAASYYDSDAVVTLLIAKGAPAEIQHVPFGRGGHYLDSASPGCGTMVSKDLPNRGDFHWIAQSLDYDVVIAATTDDAPPPEAGALVATYQAKVFLDMLEQAGYRPIDYHSDEQAAALFQSGRVGYVALGGPDFEHLPASIHRPLWKVKVLGHITLWLACNGAVEPGDAAEIETAWRQAAESGQILKIYESTGIARYLPGGN